MNGRAIPGAYLFRLCVCDKEMSWPHHIGETHQPDWVVYVSIETYGKSRFRLTKMERIIFVSRGITVFDTILRKYLIGLFINSFVDQLTMRFVLKMYIGLDFIKLQWKMNTSAE